jgi:leucyl/phenylalanyl-tRNA--protein transferase
VIPLLDDDDTFPPVSRSLDASSGLSGLLAATRSISASRLGQAYRSGIFPWYSEGQPILWWSPDPRMVLQLDEFRCGHGLRRALKRDAADARLTFGFDIDFKGVMRRCAAVPRTDQDGTWITDDIIAAYSELHVQGFAHSFELREKGELIGGGYGVAIGRMFYGESMFAIRRDASKVALCGLVDFASRHEFRMIDCQQNTRHLGSLGAREISRTDFIRNMTALIERTQLTDWPAQWPLTSALESLCCKQSNDPT